MAVSNRERVVRALAALDAVSIETAALSGRERRALEDISELRLQLESSRGLADDDTYAALDAIERVLTALGVPAASEVGRSKEDAVRLRFEAKARKATPDTTQLDAEPIAGLKPWRLVVQPHDDVARGRFSLAEFAADLHLVAQGEGADEYAQPIPFFRRTYLTDGLRTLLSQSAQRIAGHGGVPVIDLQTTFGGGKTHSMIAIHHLFSGTPMTEFTQEVQELLDAVQIAELPAVRRVVLVGTKLKVGQPDVKGDGTHVATMWGELAWQLGGSDAYGIVAESDRNRSNPGDALLELFRRYAPCVVLIDEWVAYARQLWADDSLPAGTFDTHMTFAQALTEAARAVPGVLLVISIPASADATQPGSEPVGSEMEVGGFGGRQALQALQDVIGRMESSWRPATAEESFEIVRRRLFEPIDPDLLPDRDATAAVFGDYYRKQASELPSECREPRYVDRIKAAYPIHPELFARLYEDWSTLPGFQRTRGVLRLMASVIYALWQTGDQYPLVLPGTVPLDDPAVVAELTRNLEDSWKPILDADVDGPGSLPASLDDEFKNLGRYHATRRVARAVFLASAPSAKSPNRGVETTRVRLGSAFPGESLAVFGDALGRLGERATYLYGDGGRWWYGVQPSVNRLAQERSERFRTRQLDEVHAEIRRRVEGQRGDGEFAGVHVMPATSGDVADEDIARLVVLSPEHPHVARTDASPAVRTASELLATRGGADRLRKNMLVFLAADNKRLGELEQAVADYLAWGSVEREAIELNLDAHQSAQAKARYRDADGAATLRVSETYQWVLVPDQPEPTGPIGWQTLKVDGPGPLAERVSRRLVTDGALHSQLAPVHLRLQLDGPLASLWKDGRVEAGELWEAFSRYVYLPRLVNQAALLDAIQRGPGSTTWQSEGFATADAVDAEGRLLGLVTGSLAGSVGPGTLVVSPAAALAQIEEELPDEETEGATSGPTTAPVVAPKYSPRRFHGSVALGDRPGRDFDRLLQEVISHLQGVVGAEVEVTVEISADAAGGFPATVVRTVSENANTLKLQHGFEET